MRVPAVGRQLLVRHGARFCRFGVVGLSGVLVNMLVLYVLVSRDGWPHLGAAVCSGEAAIVSNYLLHERWTFRDVTVREGWPRRLLRYHVVALGGQGIALGLLAVLTLGWGMNYLWANLVGIGVGTLWNYGVNAWYTWDLRGLLPVLDLATSREG